MEEIKANVQGVRITRQPDGSRHVVLVAANELQADILRHTLGDSISVRYSYDGSDITWYLVFELPHIQKNVSHTHQRHQRNIEMVGLAGREEHHSRQGSLLRWQIEYHPIRGPNFAYWFKI